MIIGIYDEDYQQRYDLIKKLLKLKEEKKCRIKDIQVFDHEGELLTEIEKGKKFDLLFIEPIYGMETARKIRSQNQEIKIIFQSDSQEYAVDSYSVNAFYYFLKPVNEELLLQVLKKVEETTKSESEAIIVHTNDGIYKLNDADLEFCEIIKRNIYYYLRDGKVISENGTMVHLEEKLKTHECFVKVHRSYIINIQHVYCFNYKGITMENDRIIPIPRGKLKNIKEILLSYERPVETDAE